MPTGSPGEPGLPASEDCLLATADLLRLAKGGDDGARAQLFTRCVPRLQRWAAGRLPAYARSLFDTGDLVQETLMRVFQGLDRVRENGPGGFQSYVRQALLNRIRDEIRWAARRPGPEGVPETLDDPAPSPLENAIGADVLARYERALAGLTEGEQELLHLRIELDFEYKEIATMLGRPSGDAVRMAVQRALARLAEAMRYES